MRARDQPSSLRAPSPENRAPRVALPLLIVGLALAYLPTLAPPLVRQVGLDMSGWGPAATLVWNWVAVALLLLHVTYGERLGTASLRLVRPTEQDLSWAGWLGGGAVLWHWVASQWIVPETSAVVESMEAGQAALVALGPLIALGLVLTSSITEEILWRGYAVERVGAWVGMVPAAVIGFAIFAAGHVSFFGPGWLVTVGPGAVLLYGLLLVRRNLYACMLAHFIGNIPIFLMALTHS